MSMPFYVSPEQQMKDRADFARKGIARGRSVVVVQFDEGLLFVAENASQALHKISEIYDRIVFAAVGRYNEFENLRIAGVRLADLRGYSYDRRDVTGRGLANAYAQTLGTIFSSGGEKPYEIELFVAEIGDVRADDQIYRLTYDGSVADEHGFAVMGGSAEQVSEYLRARYADDLNLESALRLAVDALAHDSTQPRTVAADNLEVALLDRTRDQPRKFRRLPDKRLVEILQQTSAPPSAAEGTRAGDGTPTGDDSSATDGVPATDETTAANAPTTNASTGAGESTSAQQPVVEASETSAASRPGRQGDAGDPSDEIGDLPDEDKPADG